MHVAHREGGKQDSKGGSYMTVKDHQVVGLHPSTGLDSSPYVYVCYPQLP